MPLTVRLEGDPSSSDVYRKGRASTKKPRRDHSIVTNYKDITCWENKRRHATLSRFHNLLKTYFRHSQSGQFGFRVETERAQRARTEINLMISEISAIVRAADNATIVIWTPPPVIGGPTESVDLLLDVFNLDRFYISPCELFDQIIRTRGVYQSDKKRSIIRTINPLWWMKNIIIRVSRFPFFIIGAAGFDTARIEQSVIGRLIKFILITISTTASVLVIADLLGALEWLRYKLGINTSLWLLPE